MPSFIKSLTFDTSNALLAATFWAAALGSSVDEDSTADKAFVEPAGWGGPTIWFQRVPEIMAAKNRLHLDLRAPGAVLDEVRRLEALGAPPFSRWGPTSPSCRTPTATSSASSDSGRYGVHPAALVRPG